MAQGELTKVESRLHTAATSSRHRSRPSRYGRTEWPCPEAIRLRMVREARQTFGMRAAGQLWFGLGLPIVPAMRAPAPQRDLFR